MSAKHTGRVCTAIAMIGMLALPNQAIALDGSTEVTIRRLEEAAPGPVAALAQTGIGDQAWWFIAGGAVMVCIALVALALARRRHG